MVRRPPGEATITMSDQVLGQGIGAQSCRPLAGPGDRGAGEGTQLGEGAAAGEGAARDAERPAESGPAARDRGAPGNTRPPPPSPRPPPAAPRRGSLDGSQVSRGSAGGPGPLLCPREQPKRNRPFPFRGPMAETGPQA